MTQYGFFVDVSKCTGCKTCMVACKDGHFAQPVKRQPDGPTNRHKK